MIQALVAWSIPDVPGILRKQIKREELLVRENIIEYEKKLAAELADKTQTPIGTTGDHTVIPTVNQQNGDYVGNLTINDDDFIPRRYSKSQKGPYDRTTPV